MLGVSGRSPGIALLALLLVQDGLLVRPALLFAALRRSPRRWHFGIRATRLWPTVGWAVLAFALMLGFELGYIELSASTRPTSTTSAMGASWPASPSRWR